MATKRSFLNSFLNVICKDFNIKKIFLIIHLLDVQITDPDVTNITQRTLTLKTVSLTTQQRYMFFYEDLHEISFFGRSSLSFFGKSCEDF